MGNKIAIGQAYQIMNNEPHTWDMVYLELAKILNVPYMPVFKNKDSFEYMDKHPEQKIEDEAFDIWCDDIIERYRRAMKDLMQDL